MRKFTTIPVLALPELLERMAGIFQHKNRTLSEGIILIVCKLILEALIEVIVVINVLKFARISIIALAFLIVNAYFSFLVVFIIVMVLCRLVVLNLMDKSAILLELTEAFILEKSTNLLRGSLVKEFALFPEPAAAFLKLCANFLHFYF